MSSKILVYAYREWSFLNIKPLLKYFDYDRWWGQKNIDITDYDLVITCEPHIGGWTKVYPYIKGNIPILGLQQSLYWSENYNKNATWNCDKFLCWGEQQAEICHRHNWNNFVITGNPRWDEFFDIDTEDEGYTLILGGGGESQRDYEEFKGKVIFQPHPNTLNNALPLDTEELIRKSHNVVFRETGAGVIAMIMGKPVKIFPTENIEERKYYKSKLYNSGEFGYDKDFLRWAIGEKGATERVRDVISRTC